MKIQDIKIKERVKTKAKFLPMGDKILKYTEFDVLEQEVRTYKDMLLMAFRWDSTPEGHDYWQSVVDSIEPPNMPTCPKCNNPKIDFKRKVQLYCCKKCQINFDETRTKIYSFRPYTKPQTDNESNARI
jgi:ribosomal protein L37AE/L43A